MRPRDLFRRLSLDVKLISSYLVILGIGGLAISVVGSWIVSTTIWREAQRTVAHDLAIARTVYDQRLELVRRTVEASAAGITIPRHLETGDRAALAEYLGEVRRQGGLDLLGLTDASGRVLLRPGGEPAGGAGGELASLAPVRSALAGRAAAATAVVPAEVLAREDPALARRARMRRLATPHARPAPLGDEPAEQTSGLVLLAAAQVVMNILMNAVQAMDERRTLTLGTRHDPERGEVVLTFRDTGCGIPADRIDRIFDPFFTTNRNGQGTGLGLSIAYGIVARHHGTIAVESEVGAGTTFTIRLPVDARFEEGPPVLETEPLVLETEPP